MAVISPESHFARDSLEFEKVEVQQEPSRTFSSFVQGYMRLPVKVTRK